MGLDRRQPFLQRRGLGPRVVKLARQSRGIGDRRVEQLANLGQVLFCGRRAPACFRVSASASSRACVDVGVGLDGGIEVAVERLGALRLFLNLLAQ